MKVYLPWPPSANNYWRHVGKKVLISKKGRVYRKNVQAAVVQQVGILKPMTQRLRVTITAYPPDKRIRDIDNLLKACLDAMKHASVYKDDSLIDRLEIERGAVRAGGELMVIVWPRAEDYID